MTTKYNIYRDSEKVISNLSETTFTDTGLLPFTTYNYQIEAVNKEGGKSKSEVLKVTTDYADIEDSEADVILGDLEVSNDKIILTVKTAIENPFSLEVDHSHGNNGKFAEKREDNEWYLKGTDYPAVPEFTVYADSNNVWGDSGALAMADGLGVSATYHEDRQVWVIEIANDGDDYELANIINSVGDIEFYLVVANTEGKESGSMEDGTYVVID